MNTKKFFPKSFEMLDGVLYFRLEDGKISAERIGNVVIKSSIKDEVELVTFEKDSEKVSGFWKINNSVFALAASSSVVLPNDTIFVDCYFSNNRQYVKYVSNGMCGIISVNDTEIKHIVTFQSRYVEITFENGFFYASYINGNCKYHILDEAGNLIKAFSTKCRKVDNEMLFYHESKIFIKSSEFEIPNGIESVKMIYKGEMAFIKITNKKGIYYYTKNMLYLLGPIIKDEIIYNDKRSCYVNEIKNNKNTKIFFIKYEEDGGYICKSLCADEDIDIYLFDKQGHFFVDGKVVYTFSNEKMEFIPLIKNNNVDKFVFSMMDKDKFTLPRVWYIVGIKDEKPNYLACILGGKQVIEENMFKILFLGWDDETYICKGKNKIFAITKTGKVLFRTIGQDCSKKRFEKNGKYEGVYLIKVKKDVFELYSKEGKKFDIV